MRFRVDVTEARAALQGVVRLRLEPGHDLDIHVADLDTGSAFAVTGPSDDIPAALLQNADLVSVIDVAGGRNVARRLQGTLRFDGWDHPDTLEVVVSPTFARWLIGMPVLCKFHLLLPRQEMVTADEAL